MGVVPIASTPGIELLQKSIPEPKLAKSTRESGYTIFVSYEGVLEKVLVTPKTTPEELQRTLLAICGIPSTEDARGLKVTLWTSNGEQVQGEITENTFLAPYKILITNNDPDVKAAKDLDTLARKIKALDMDKVFCDGSLYVLNENPKIYSEHFKVTPETSEWLKSPTFNNWLFSDSELVTFIIHIYNEVGILKDFDLPVQILYNFVEKVRGHYLHNPFHNFKHAFCCYALIVKSGFIRRMTPLEKLSLLTSCLGHDLDHPGYNNMYQINARTDLAIIYNDQSPLENHHSESCNLLKPLSREDVSYVRKLIIKLIMATDMAKHGDSVTAFNKIAANFSFDDAIHREMLLCIFIKCADISNEVRPPPVADIWVNRLLEEFFSQSDREKQDGLPFLPFMDRDKVTKSGAQTGFLGFCVIPLFEALAKVYPNIKDDFLTPIKNSLEFYKQLGQKEKA